MAVRMGIPVNPEKAVEIESSYRQLVQGMPGAVYTCDREGRITFYNKASAALWGRKPEIGKDMWCGSWKIYEADGYTLMPLEKCPMAMKLRGQKVKPGTEIIIERPDGVKRNVAVYPETIYDSSGNIAGAFNMLMDITVQKRAESVLRVGKEQYRKLAEDLEMRVQRRTQALSKANQYLERSNKELEQFAFVTSHDLQEPLRKIQTYGEILYNKHAGSMDEKGRAYLGKIVSSSRRLSTLINSLLTFSLLNQPGGTLEPVDLNKVLHDVLDDFELLIKEKQAVINADPLPWIKADPLQINQIFSNLVSNALKFSREGVAPVIEIKIRKLPAKEMALHVSLDKHLSYFELLVVDNGIGFEQKHAEKIFEIFQRLHDKQTYKGTGIGLTICAKAVANHRGHIYARSGKKKGASFYVLLPFEHESTPGNLNQTGEPAPAAES